MKPLTTGVLLAALAVPGLRAQAFEVASVKHSNLGGGVHGGCRGIDSHYGPAEAESAPPLGRCVILDGRLGHLITIAFDLHSTELIQGGPDWVATGVDRFNIEAKAEEPTKTTERELKAMLQALLVERFGLKFHRQTVERPGFALIVGKKGPKLHAAKGEDETISFGNDLKPARGRPVALTARYYSMAKLAEMLGFASDRGPVVDQTGLDGVYDFTLSWDEENGPTLSTALDEQLGLRLQSQKVPVSLFVIESAHKPSEN
jgi:uncharacterized protein (TIGR03435 family)